MQSSGILRSLLLRPPGVFCNGAWVVGRPKLNPTGSMARPLHGSQGSQEGGEQGSPKFQAGSVPSDSPASAPPHVLGIKHPVQSHHTTEVLLGILMCVGGGRVSPAGSTRTPACDCVYTSLVWLKTGQGNLVTPGSPGPLCCAFCKHIHHQVNELTVKADPCHPPDPAASRLLCVTAFPPLCPASLLSCCLLAPLGIHDPQSHWSKKRGALVCNPGDGN